MFTEYLNSRGSLLQAFHLSVKQFEDHSTGKDFSRRIENVKLYICFADGCYFYLKFALLLYFIEVNTNLFKINASGFFKNSLSMPRFYKRIKLELVKHHQRIKHLLLASQTLF